MSSTRLEEARQAWSNAVERMEDLDIQLQGLPDETDAEVVSALEERFNDAKAEAERKRQDYARAEIIQGARQISAPSNEDNEHADEQRGVVTLDETRRTAGARVSVGKEPVTYDQRNSNGNYYFADLFEAGRGDIRSQERLQRHRREVLVEKRDLTSTLGAGGDFEPPIWMMDEWTNVIRMGRPFANSLNNQGPPPPGASINIPRLVTGTAVAAQSDIGAVQQTDATTGQFTIPIKTLAGQQKLAQQLIDRSQPGIDQIIFQDLVQDYNLRVDLQVLSGSGSGANAKGVLSDTNRITETYTQATPAVGGAGGFYAKIADAVQQIITQRGLPPDTIVMHPRRWGWITASADTTGRPLMEIGGGGDLQAPGQAGGVNQLGDAGFRMQGLRVIVDANLPTTLGAGTNEDTALVYRAADLYLWEGQPIMRAFPQTFAGNLEVLLQVYSYFAFTSERYSKAVAQITGTGMVAPTF
jgi:HK97 family phage major capsid protein